MGRYVCNAIVGTFESGSEVYLANMEFMEVVNHSSIARFINSTISKISSCPDDFLVCITYGAAYMKKAIQGIFQLYFLIFSNFFINFKSVYSRVASHFTETDLCYMLGAWNSQSL